MFGKFKMHKRGMTLQDAPQLIILLVVIGIIGAIGLSVLAGVSAGFTGSASAAIANITEGIGNFFSLTPVLGTIFIAVLLLAAVVGLFSGVSYMRNR